MRTDWHFQTTRPLTRNDVGRFVVGYGVAGWAAGYLEEMHHGYLVVDTGRHGGPMNGNVVADIIETYRFLDDVPV